MSTAVEKDIFGMRPRPCRDSACYIPGQPETIPAGHSLNCAAHGSYTWYPVNARACPRQGWSSETRR